MIVDTYLTLNINYGELELEVSGHVVTPTSAYFSKGDVIKFTCERAKFMAVKGWHVFHADNIKYHRTGHLPMYFKSGAQWTQEIELVMHYDHDVIVVCEMT